VGLRTIIVGGAIEAAAARLAARVEIEILRVTTTADALARVDGSEPVIVLLPVSDVESELSEIATLVSRGAQVVALSSDTSPSLRVAAFSAGISDVLFAPFEPWFVEEVVLALAGNPLRKDARVPTQMEALLVPLGGIALSGNLMSLSMGELRARVSGSLPPGAILRVALKPPLPHRIPVLFARAKKAETLEDGRLEIHARFVGVTAEELALLGAYLEQQPAEVEDVAAVLAVIDSLDARVLRDSGGTLAGLTLPAFTAPETAWLRAQPGTADAALADVAIARCRAELTASLMDAVGADLITLAGLPLERYLDDMHRAKRAVAAALELFRRGDAALVAELTGLQARLDESAATLERIANQIAESGGSAASAVAPLEGTRVPPSPPRAPRKTATGIDEPELALELDDLIPVPDESPFDSRPAGESTKESIVPAEPPDDLANARTNPQISVPDYDTAARTNPVQLSPQDAINTNPVLIPPEGPRVIPPPPAIAPTTPGVAIPRTGRRLRNPFADE
jgi:hypothetical protein